MLPADGISVTTIWFFVSSSWMVSPLRRAAYCADAGSVVAIRTRIAKVKVRISIARSSKSASSFQLPAASLKLGAESSQLGAALFRQREAVERVPGRHRHVLAA